MPQQTVPRNFLGAAIAALVLVPVIALAWDDTGHMTIAKIAYDRLTPSVRAKVDALLAANPAPDFTDFVRSGTYPDQLKRYGIKLYSPWHAISLPFPKDGIVPPANATRPDNVVWAIGECVKGLTDPHTIPYERARELRFLIHFVGDVHLPVHATTLYDKDHPNGDDNGHGYLLGEGKKDHLHGVWDTAFGIYHDLPDSRQADLSEIDRLAKEVLTEVGTSDFGNAQDLDPSDWAKESHQIAIDFAYSTPEHQKPSDAYVKKCRQICAERAALAGYRLANLLNKAFGEG